MSNKTKSKGSLRIFLSLRLIANLDLIDFLYFFTWFYHRIREI
jgi:hypothetical protein